MYVMIVEPQAYLIIVLNVNHIISLELEEYLDLILVKKQDPMKGAREKMLRELNINNNFSAQNILNDIKQELEINE